jgi:hypothetical protein
MGRFENPPLPAYGPPEHLQTDHNNGWLTPRLATLTGGNRFGLLRSQKDILLIYVPAKYLLVSAAVYAIELDNSWTRDMARLKCSCFRCHAFHRDMMAITASWPMIMGLAIFCFQCRRAAGEDIIHLAVGSYFHVQPKNST